MISLAQSFGVGQFGSLLKHVSPVNIDPSGLIPNTADRFVTLPDGKEALTVSGTALQSGILHKPLVRSTGYDQSPRNQGDFGLDVYIIWEV